MMSWSQRMAEARRHTLPNASSADSADRSDTMAIGAIGTIGIGPAIQAPEPVGKLSAPSALSAQPVAAIPPCPATVTERAALIEYGAGCARAEADTRALAEFGLASWRALADAHAGVIRPELDRLQAPTCREGYRLLKVTREFLTTEHWLRAVACGWPLLDLFGVHEHAPLVRIEAWGAIATLALSNLSPTGFAKITANEVVLACRSSATKLVHRAGSHGMRASVVWWRCASLISEVAP